MALETTLVYETSLPISFTCADGTGIEKGAILKLSDPNTVSLTAGDTDPVAGIAAEEKIANDGKTKIAVYLGGIFRVEAGATCTVGYEAVLFGKNEVEDYDASDREVGKVCGRFLETGTDGEFIALAQRFRGLTGQPQNERC